MLDSDVAPVGDSDEFLGWSLLELLLANNLIPAPMIHVSRIFVVCAAPALKRFGPVSALSNLSLTF